MEYTDIELLAQAIGRAVAEAVGSITINVDGQALGYAAADAINMNRARDGRTSLEL